ncbi:MAG: helix-turn-helix domain-containing protein, partial [Aquipseudomonas alcaligenes]
MSYHELSATERVTIQIGLCNGFSQRRLARLMNRSPSTVSREIRPNRNAQAEYLEADAHLIM